MIDLPLRPGRSPRAWQPTAAEAVQQAFRDGRRTVLVSAPTGVGKGDWLVALAILAARKGNRVAVVSHTDELVLDLFERVKLAGHDAGLVKAEHGDWSHPIVVASRQTLVKRLDHLRAWKAALCLYDEGHLALDAQQALRPFFGRWAACTATPFRSAGRGETAGLGDVYESVVYEYGILDAIAAGDLCKVEGRRVALDVDLSGVDLDDEDDLAARYDIAEINAAIAADYHEHHAGQPAIFFCCNVAHAEHLAAALGPRFAAVSGDDPAREEKVAAYKRGDLDGLCNRDLLVFGFDAPRTAIVGLAAPTSSVVRYMQMIGRGTRAGKPRCVVVDYCGSTETMQAVTWADLSRAEKDAARREKKKRDKEARERAENVGAGIEGQQSYEVHIFGDAAGRRLGIGWYEWQRAYVASARRHGSHLRAEVVIERDGPGWVAVGLWRDTPRERREWVKGQPRRLLDGGDTVEELWRGTLDQCGSAAAEFFHQRGLRPEAQDAAWKAQPATEAQLRALKAWGVKRAGLSRGEASCILDATVARRKVQEARRLDLL